MDSIYILFLHRPFAPLAIIHVRVLFTVLCYCAVAALRLLSWSIIICQLCFFCASSVHACAVVKFFVTCLLADIRVQVRRFIFQDNHVKLVLYYLLSHL
jgi:hypothetical protein